QRILAGLGFRAENHAAGVHHRDISIESSGSCCHREYHRVWTKADQVTSNSVTPHAMTEHAEAFYHFVVNSTQHAAANLRVTVEGGDGRGRYDREHSDPGRGHHAAQLKMEFIGIPRHLCEDVRERIGRARIVVVVVKLACKLRIEG